MRLALGLLIAAALHAQPAYIHGTVFDPTGAVIATAQIKVTSEQRTCETRTDTRGEFHCQLPPGTYTLTTNIPGFLPEKRTAMTLPAGHSFVKIRPVLNGLGVGSIVDGEGLHSVVIPSPDPAPKIEERRINGTEILIRYNETIKSDGSIIFHGHDSRVGGPYLMLTSNLLTVYADEITCTETFQSCTAQGKVRVETGTGEEFEGTQADIDLPNHKFKLTRTATVEQSF